MRYLPSKHIGIIPIYFICILLLIACSKVAHFPDLQLSTDELTVDHQGFDDKGKAPVITISASADWTVQSNEEWIETNTPQGGGSRTIVTIKVSPNFTQSDRTGSILFKNALAEKKLIIHQKQGQVNLEEIIYEIPVIFHIFYNEEDVNRDEKDNKRTSRIGSREVEEMLKEVNWLYGAEPITKEEQERDERNIRERQNIHRLKTNIRFVLASTTPDGKRLQNQGVTRTAIPSSYLDPYKVLQDTEGGDFHSMAWPLDRYINVFLFPFTPTSQGDNSEGLLLGIASLPHAHPNHPIAGLNVVQQRIKKVANYNHAVVINSNAFEQRVYSRTFLGKELINQTLAHELGHYLALQHPFSEVKSEGSINLDSCEDTDFCEDTPSYNRLAYDRLMRDMIGQGGYSSTMLVGLLSRTDCKSQARFISMNIMDYDVSYADRFTPNQQQRMRSALYYSPTLPGPKMISFDTKSRAGSTHEEGIVEVEPQFAKCRWHLWNK